MWFPPNQPTCIDCVKFRFEQANRRLTPTDQPTDWDGWVAIICFGSVLVVLLSGRGLIREASKSEMWVSRIADFGAHSVCAGELSRLRLEHFLSGLGVRWVRVVNYAHCLRSDRAWIWAT